VRLAWGRYGRVWCRRRCCGREKVSDASLVAAEHERAGVMRMSGRMEHALLTATLGGGSQMVSGVVSARALGRRA
jgi:hypothetical protein